MGVYHRSYQVHGTSENCKKPWPAYNTTMTKRRSMLGWIGSLGVLFAVAAAGLTLSSERSSKAGPPLTVGFIYVGPKTDYGYNQAHAQGAAAIAKLPGVKIREEEMVPETVAVQKT